MLRRKPALLVCTLFAAVFFSFFGVYADDAIEDEPFVEVLSDDVHTYKEGKLPTINAASAIVMDMESGRVLYEKNAYSRRAIASTTKIMTAVIALEKGRLDDLVTVSKRASSIWGSTIGLKEGQQWKLKDLLYGLMLSSGNDAAIAIAEHIGGTVEKFAEMMTEKAIQIGARNTSFKSPHGLDMEGHYSTAYDLAMITRYALQNEIFAEIVKTKSAVIADKNLRNTNEMLSVYQGADGVKTGYTGQAGRCLVTSATRDGWRLISVVLGSPTRYARAQSSKTILDYAFTYFKPYTLVREGERLGSIQVYKGIQESVPVAASETIRIPLKAGEYEALEKKVYLPDSIPAPVYAGVSTGTLRFLLNGEVIAETKLKTTLDIRRKNMLDYMGHVFHTWMKMLREGFFNLDGSGTMGYNNLYENVDSCNELKIHTLVSCTVVP